MKKMIFLSLYVFSLSSCIMSKVELENRVFKIEDINGMVCKKVFWSTPNTLDSTLYIKFSGEIVHIDSYMKKQAIPNIAEPIDVFIKKNLLHPLNDNYLSPNNVLLLLFIDERGNNTEIRVIRAISQCDLCTMNAIDVIRKIGKWQPALNDFGMPISCTLFVSVKFHK